MNEQTANGLRVAELGLGAHLEREAVDVTSLREAVERVGSDEAIREHVSVLAREMHDVDGPGVAADAVERFLNQHR